MTIRINLYFLTKYILIVFHWNFTCVDEEPGTIPSDEKCGRALLDLKEIISITSSI